MSRWLQVLLAGALGYLAGALVGYAAVIGLSGNVHDSELEATVTALLISGPLFGLLSMPLAWWMLRRQARRGAGDD